MEPYILTTKNKKKFGGFSGVIKFVLLIYLVASLILAYIFAIASLPMSLFLKVVLALVPIIIFVVKIKSRSPQKAIPEDSILLKIDENGIAIRPDSDTLYASIKFKHYDISSKPQPQNQGLVKLSWKEIRYVKVKAGRSEVMMYINAIGNQYYFDFIKNGGVSYYHFRHKLLNFADDKSKITCPKTTIANDFGLD